VVPWEVWEDLEAMVPWVQDPVVVAWGVVEVSTAHPMEVGLEVNREAGQEADCRREATRLW